MGDELFLLFDKRQRRIFRIQGSAREEILGIRPQGTALLGYMDDRNRANHYRPVVCSYEELAAAIGKGQESGGEKEDVAHLVLEIRRKIEPDPRNPRLLKNVRHRGYVLVTRRSAGREAPCEFLCGPPIADPRHFFGRTKELKQLLDLWKGAPIQHVAILGRKRSGKTSLLHYLSHIGTTPASALRPTQRNGWPPPDSYHVALVDFQDSRMQHRARLLTHLLRELHLPVPNSCSLEQFMDVLSEHLRERSIILYDEIDAAFAVPELDHRFWESFRSLACNQTGGLLGFVLTSSIPLAELARAHHHAKSSPFLNIFGHSLELGPLTDAEARDLIGGSPIPFAPEDVEWILKESRRWPCLLQILCHSRLTSLKECETGEDWKPRGLQAMRPFRHLIEADGVL